MKQKYNTNTKHCWYCNCHVFLYARRRRDVVWDHPWQAGGWAASTSLSGAYLQNYSSYGYEISWVDRSHQGGVQCAGIITLASLIFLVIALCFFSYLNFVRSISPKYTS